MNVVATPLPALPGTAHPKAVRSASVKSAQSKSVHAASTSAPPAYRKPLRVKPLPAGLPREWYEDHNRRLKALRLATALLATGAYHPSQARNRRIRAIAPLIGVHPPSDTTCRMVRSLLSL